MRTRARNTAGELLQVRVTAESTIQVNRLVGETSRPGGKVAEMRARRAHMVSKVYLRAWGDSKGRVEVIDLEQGRGFQTTIESATVVSYAHYPGIMAVNLEEEFSRIESAAAPALKKLRAGAALTREEQTALVAFLDMHLERSRYADQTKIMAPALVLKTNGETEETNLNLGDRLLLTRYIDGPTRLAELGLEDWTWQLYSGGGLATGDDAVLLWRETNDSDLCTVTFPISPTHMLVIGQDIDPEIPINNVLALQSRRWLVGGIDTLTKERSKIASVRNGGHE